MGECSNCGALVREGDAFCGECGAPLGPPDRPLVEPKHVAPTLIGPSLPAAPAAGPQAPARAARRGGRTVWVLAGTIGALLVFLCLGAALLIYFAGRSGDPTPTPVSAVALPPTEAPLVAPPPTAVPALEAGAPTAGSLLFADHFDDEGSGWDVYVENDTEVGYVDQEYHVAINRPNFVAWGNPADGTEFDDFMFEADVRLVEGPVDNNIGLLVRYQPDNENFYWFEISSDGYYSVDLLQADQWVTLQGWQASEAIRQGVGAVNHLQVVCDGGRFSFYANGTHLTDVSDGAFARGNIGVGAGVFDEAGVVVAFDNVRVYQLGE